MIFGGLRGRRPSRRQPGDRLRLGVRGVEAVVVEAGVAQREPRLAGRRGARAARRRGRAAARPGPPPRAPRPRDRERAQQQPQPGGHHRCHDQQRLLEGAQHAVVDGQVRHQHDQAERGHRAEGQADELARRARRCRRRPCRRAPEQPDQAEQQEHLEQAGARRPCAAAFRWTGSRPERSSGLADRRSAGPCWPGTISGRSSAWPGCRISRSCGAIFSLRYVEGLCDEAGRAARAGSSCRWRRAGRRCPRSRVRRCPWPVIAATVSLQRPRRAWPPVCVTGPAHSRLATTRKATTTGLSSTSGRARLCVGARRPRNRRRTSLQHDQRDQADDEGHQHDVRRRVVRQHHADAEERDDQPSRCHGRRPARSPPAAAGPGRRTRSPGAPGRACR